MTPIYYKSCTSVRLCTTTCIILIPFNIKVNHKGRLFYTLESVTLALLLCLLRTMFTSVPSQVLAWFDWRFECVVFCLLSFSLSCFWFWIVIFFHNISYIWSRNWLEKWYKRHFKLEKPMPILLVNKVIKILYFVKRKIFI